MKLYGAIYFAGILLTIILSVILGWISVSYDRTDTWLIRAKDAGNPTQVAEFLKEYTNSLEKRDLVDGRYYSVWRYPATDMDTYVRIISGLVQRAEAISRQDATDESYQMGLINLEKDLGDIDARAFSVWFASGGFILVWILVLLGIWVIFGWIPLLY